MLIQAIVAVSSVVMIGLAGLQMTDRAHQATSLPLTRATFDEAVSEIRFALADTNTCLAHLQPVGPPSLVDGGIFGVRVLDASKRPLYDTGRSAPTLNFKQHQIVVNGPYGADLTDGTKMSLGDLTVTAERVNAFGSPELSETIPILLHYNASGNALVGCSIRPELLRTNPAGPPNGPRTALACIDRGGIPEPRNSGLSTFYCRYMAPDPAMNDSDRCPLDPSNDAVIASELRWKRVRADENLPPGKGLACE